VSSSLTKLNAGLASNGPLLLAAAGLAVLIYGLARGSLAALGIAVPLLVFAVVLPRLHGQFKFSAQGIEGNLQEQVVREVEAGAHREKLPPSEVKKVVDAAQEAVPAGTAITTIGRAELSAPDGALTTVVDETEERIARYIAQGVLYEELPRVRECMTCGEFGVPRDDGTCANCGRPIDGRPGVSNPVVTNPRGCYGEHIAGRA
jgi:hypothetical protein